LLLGEGEATTGTDEVPILEAAVGAVDSGERRGGGVGRAVVVEEDEEKGEEVAVMTVSMLRALASVTVVVLVTQAPASPSTEK